MRYSTVPAINFEAHVARNRELIQALPTQLVDELHWDPNTRMYNKAVVRLTRPTR